MKTQHKILLTIPAVLQAIFILSFTEIISMEWLMPSMATFRILMISMSVILWPVLFILLRRVWSFKHISSHQKGKWTLMLLIWGVIAIPFYLWRIDNQFIRMEKRAQESRISFT